MFCFFFFKQKTAYEVRISDWSSDVCSSDLCRPPPFAAARGHLLALAVVRADAGDAAQRLGDAVGGRLPGRAGRRHRAAADHAARPGPVRLAARRAPLARAAAVRHVPAAPGGGAVPRPGPARRRAGKHGFVAAKAGASTAAEIGKHKSELQSLMSNSYAVF